MILYFYPNCIYYFKRDFSVLSWGGEESLKEDDNKPNLPTVYSYSD